jgi:REP element-mobilizing transposase RayT
MKQQSRPPRREHGGALSYRSRRSRRPLSTKEPLHLTLRSEFATGPRSLLRNRDLVMAILRKAQKLYRIRVYQFSICGNHLHGLIIGRSRVELQNFYRVFAGHLAQNILFRNPLSHQERRRCEEAQTGCKKNKRTFWQLLIYTRIVSWGREFSRVKNYIVQNDLEALNKIAYQPRQRSRGRPP